MKLSFYQHLTVPKKFFALENSDIELDDNTYYYISRIRGIKYRINESEKIKKTTHLKLKKEYSSMITLV